MKTLSSAPARRRAVRSFFVADSARRIFTVLDQWFAWRPVKTSNRTVWLDWVWRIREAGSARYVARYF